MKGSQLNAVYCPEAWIQASLWADKGLPDGLLTPTDDKQAPLSPFQTSLNLLTPLIKLMPTLKGSQESGVTF